MKNRKNQPGGPFEQLTAQYGVSVGEIICDMQIAVDDAWDNSNPEIRAKQRQLSPSGNPSVEEFIRVMAEQVKK